MYKLKRAMDIILAILISPIAAVIIIVLIPLIKIDSPGSILYKAKRVGENNKIIKVYKLRTMYQKQIRINKRDYEKRFKLKDDPRITRFGRVLRKTSLDELPQILNVIKGEMSFVGPRPIIIEERKTYSNKGLALYTSVKPGLTGLWQISGRNNLPYAEKAKLDSEYIKNIGFWSDIKILIKTIKVLFTCEGAY